jgi:hypothetical protein
MPALPPPKFPKKGLKGGTEKHQVYWIETYDLDGSKIRLPVPHLPIPTREQLAYPPANRNTPRRATPTPYNINTNRVKRG